MTKKMKDVVTMPLGYLILFVVCTVVLPWVIYLM